MALPKESTHKESPQVCPRVPEGNFSSKEILTLELKIRKNDDIYIIDVNGEMDLYNSYKLKELVMKMLEKKIQKFVINLESVDYIDSSGIGALIYISSTLKKLNLRLLICNVRGSVKKVIELTKLMGYFPITGTVVDAVKDMKD